MDFLEVKFLPWNVQMEMRVTAILVVSPGEAEAVIKWS